MFANFLKDGRIKVLFAYDPKMVAAVKATNVATWRKAGKYWVLTPNLTAIDFILTNGFQISAPDMEKLDVRLNEIQKESEVQKIKVKLWNATTAPAGDM